MFYQANDIDDVVKCCICEHNMTDPRILPCGKSMCNECIYLIAENQNCEVKCYDCGQIHLIPEKGFVKNLALKGIVRRFVIHEREINELKYLILIVDLFA